MPGSLGGARELLVSAEPPGGSRRVPDHRAGRSEGTMSTSQPPLDGDRLTSAISAAIVKLYPEF